MQPTKSSRALTLVLHVLFLSLFALVAFAATVLLVGLLVGALTGTEVAGGGSQSLGIMCGLIAWLFIAVFHLKKESQFVPVPDRGSFVEQLTSQLQELGYAVKTPFGDQVVGRPSFRSWLFGGGVRVQINRDWARLVGPRVSLELLRHRLRAQTVLDNDRKALSDSRLRHGSSLLRRVQISMRVPAGQLQEVYNQVGAVLAAEGAEVVCDVNILAQSEVGMREDTVNLRVREWLRRQQIAATIHKEPLSPARTALVG